MSGTPHGVGRRRFGATVLALAALLPDPTNGLIAATLCGLAIAFVYWKAGALPERDVAALRQSMPRARVKRARSTLEAAQP